MMNIKSKSSLLLAVMTVVIACHAEAQQTNSVHRNYADDAIVRDLKAGKLTVREAQILRDRRGHRHPVVRAEGHKAAMQKVKAGKPIASGKRMALKKSKAPVRHLTGLHGKNKANKANKAIRQAKAAPAASGHAHQRVVARTEPVRTAKAQSTPMPVRRTAVKYIR